MRDRTEHSGVAEDPCFVERDCISRFVFPTVLKERTALLLERWRLHEEFDPQSLIGFAAECCEMELLFSK
jgi:hypothetical protein